MMWQINLSSHAQKALKGLDKPAKKVSKPLLTGL